jgi:hypothetical protein
MERGMADSNNQRTHRVYDPPQRADGGEGARGGGDPLAELARLIGQSDPFADLERNHRAAAAQGAPAAPAHPTAPAEPAASPTYAAQPAAPQPDTAAYADDAPPADPYPQGHDPYYDSYYEDDQDLDEAEYLEEQQRRRRRRRRRIVVAAILALAVLGGAGAYGFRTYYGSGMTALPPPVIRADTTPTKVIPAAQAGDSASNKLIYDRVGETGQAERVVPREEKPVDVRTATVTPPARAIYPAPDANIVAGSPPSTIAVTGQRSTGQVLPVATEPSIAAQGTGAILPSAKKVRTVTIRPDMTVVPSGPAVTPLADPEPPPRITAPPPRPAEAPPPQRSAAPSPAPALGPPPTATPVRSAPSAPSRQQAAAPLSLSPGGVAGPTPRVPAPAAQQRMEMAAVPPAAASEPRTTAAGSFMVQVSSQRSEADAEASYRALQSRYPNILGGRSSIVRRADLGSKGVYYRSMVGPFASPGQAAQFCTSLKAAGGQCIIHRK